MEQGNSPQVYHSCQNAEENSLFSTVSTDNNSSINCSTVDLGKTL